MKIIPQRRLDGIAMIIVMIVLLVLGVLAAGFAYSMKVETRLAQNSGFRAILNGWAAPMSNSPATFSCRN